MRVTLGFLKMMSWFFASIVTIVIVLLFKMDEKLGSAPNSLKKVSRKRLQNAQRKQRDLMR